MLLLEFLTTTTVRMFLGRRVILVSFEAIAMSCGNPTHRKHGILSPACLHASLIGDIKLFSVFVGMTSKMYLAYADFTP